MEIHFGGGEIAVISTLLAAVVGALTVVFKLFLVTKDQQLKDRDIDIVKVREDRDVWRSIAMDAQRVLISSEERRRTLEGKIPTRHLAAVVPEHQSPPTDAQVMTAEQATVRALVTAVAAELQVPPRMDFGHSPEPPNRESPPQEEGES